ncbi:DUF488 family protein [Ktedonospora formicarum]|uniref:DUF488 domain-containing protein n=1 Tax=Ktedonospora formicarum TaxID=2778364 RepID=A0A8J3ICB5_9CHLR|nr:DUF488 family protein [Ktedonospora formicarum]GHO51406.1 hypothetical protein KSX_95690 [Ktedonospora formicarum]
MIRELSIYALRALSPEERISYGYRVLVMRRWSRGISWREIDAWLPEAGPTLQLLQTWQQAGISWHDFECVYLFEQELLSSCTLRLPHAARQEYQGCATDLLLDLEQRHGVVTLLCHEAEGPCHRFTLKERLEHLQRTLIPQEGEDAKYSEDGGLERA